MQMQNTKNGYILLAIAGVLVLLGIGILFVWSSGNKATPTATLSVSDIYTEVAQTVVAQQATQQALNPPTASPFPTFPPLAPTSATQAAIPTALLIVSPTTAANQGCDNAVFVKDVTIPDNTIMSPGQTFIKTWTMQNNGSCTWDTNYKFAFASGDAMSGVTTALTASVPPGQQIDISVNLTAPTQTGTYKGYWRMINNSGVFFGDSPWVLIQVANATATNTSAPPTATTVPATATPITPTP